MRFTITVDMVLRVLLRDLSRLAQLPVGLLGFGTVEIDHGKAFSLAWTG